MMPGFSLEQLDPQDWQRLREVQLRAMRDSPDVFGRTLEQEEMCGEKEWRFRAARGVTLIATAEVADGVVEDVGIAAAAACPGEPGSATFGIWVTPAWRGQGMGGRLVDEVVSWARSGGYRRMVLHVPDDNEAAIGLYERKGFEPTGACGTLPPPRSHVRKHERALELKTAGLEGEEETSAVVAPGPSAE
mmetsp:Transcript_2545/g.5122  ORF Transcript_2545/g.5122 Transcript_2545/m.5122 type:complete len:190 (-) Transcript_2545:81-650(-)